MSGDTPTTEAGGVGTEDEDSKASARDRDREAMTDLQGMTMILFCLFCCCCCCSMIYDISVWQYDGKKFELNLLRSSECIETKKI